MGRSAFRRLKAATLGPSASVRSSSSERTEGGGGGGAPPLEEGVVGDGFGGADADAVVVMNALDATANSNIPVTALRAKLLKRIVLFILLNVDSCCAHV
mmetsp:Transcript_42418/g.89065  ORF Transcript_42418/g.89065 Transcript_42418/m.89065 type:complete len:99 (+) Transcript_42418:439-735(+)